MDPETQYTWSQFVAAVTALLTVDATRAGISNFRSGMIRQGVIHMQQLIDEYRMNHEAVYNPPDLVYEGCASRGTKPPQSVIRDVYIARLMPGCSRGGPPFVGPPPFLVAVASTASLVTLPAQNGIISILVSDSSRFQLGQTIQLKGPATFTVTGMSIGGINAQFLYQPNDLPPLSQLPIGTPISAAIGNNTVTAQPGEDCIRYRTERVNWEDRFALIEGRIPLNSGMGKFCIDPNGYTFYVYPAIFDCYLLSVFWDGLKLDFNDPDETPFDEGMVGAVANWTKAHIAREVDRDIPIYDSYMKSFAMAKQKCFLAAKDKKGES